ncbi:hypothetical protein K491DRAFT_650652 [Lophiostoma macrostomum CBS 122681]|uniref:Uncharacterized protein n=1 Tax=Lophiostoma macrostomum CBS 122681 TaxID=1314788 RepID=A0A6A6TL16_9PLEO|nr:hypothetical protein K491DRAFT_650652 [Lophiostoma macrostomum CBS 122681]
MAIHQQRPRASIYVTYKVIQIVNQLRRCLKPRVSGLSTKDSLLGSKSCLGLDSKALRNVQRVVSQASPDGRKQWHHSNRIAKNSKSTRPALTVSTPGGHVSANPNASADEVQRALRSLDEDGNISPPNNALSSVCADEKRFWKGAKLNFEPCSLKERIQLLGLVVETIRILTIARSKNDDQFIIDQGHAMGLNIDEVFIANYEHLLMQLQSQLMQALADKVVETLLENNLDKRQRKLLLWFTEFPDNRRPLSTTWPWSIKPSLAVLWGVCWMFYDRRPDEQHTGRGNPRIPQNRILRDSNLGWDTPQPGAYYNFGLDLIGTNIQRDGSGVGGGGRGGAELRQNAPDPWMLPSALSPIGQAQAQPLWIRNDPDLVSPALDSTMSGSFSL